MTQKKKRKEKVREQLYYSPPKHKTLIFFLDVDGDITEPLSPFPHSFFLVTLRTLSIYAQ